MAFKPTTQNGSMGLEVLRFQRKSGIYRFYASEYLFTFFLLSTIVYNGKKSQRKSWSAADWYTFDLLVQWFPNFFYIKDQLDGHKWGRWLNFYKFLPQDHPEMRCLNLSEILSHSVSFWLIDWNKLRFIHLCNDGEPWNPPQGPPRGPGTALVSISKSRMVKMNKYSHKQFVC